MDRFVSAFKWDLMRTCSSVSAGPDNSDERGIIGGQWKGRNKRTYLYKSSCETSAQREEMLRVKYEIQMSWQPHYDYVINHRKHM